MSRMQIDIVVCMYIPAVRVQRRLPGRLTMVCLVLLVVQESRHLSAAPSPHRGWARGYHFRWACHCPVGGLEDIVSAGKALQHRRATPEAEAASEVQIVGGALLTVIEGGR
jgi:hypothetical protein